MGECREKSPFLSVLKRYYWPSGIPDTRSVSYITKMVLSGEIDEYGSNLSDTYKAKAKAMFAEQARSLSRSQESSARPTCTTGMCAQACKIQGKIQGSEPGSREPEQGFNDRSAQGTPKVPQDAQVRCNMTSTASTREVDARACKKDELKDVSIQ